MQLKRKKQVNSSARLSGYRCCRLCHCLFPPVSRRLAPGWNRKPTTFVSDSEVWLPVPARVPVAIVAIDEKSFAGDPGSLDAVAETLCRSSGRLGRGRGRSRRGGFHFSPDIGAIDPERQMAFGGVGPAGSIRRPCPLFWAIGSEVPTWSSLLRCSPWRQGETVSAIST